MASTYTEIPVNIDRIEPFIEYNICRIKELFFSSERVYFYDACSFQRHASFKDKEQKSLLDYYKNHSSVIVIIRCILMELASDRHVLAEEYVRFLEALNNTGVKILLFDEEYTESILSECFSGRTVKNGYLSWAVKMIKSPQSAVVLSLQNNNEKLLNDILNGDALSKAELFQKLFSVLRNNKKHDDDLGEELIALCVDMLSHLPGIKDGKICVITDDKPAAIKIDSARRKSNSQNRGSKVALFSTPKLIQHMYEEGLVTNVEDVTNMLKVGTSGTVAVMGITSNDFSVNSKISMECRELANLIKEPNGIRIVF